MYLFNTNTLPSSDRSIVRFDIQNTDSGLPPNFNATYANGKAAQSMMPTMILLHLICPVAWNMVVRGVFMVWMRHKATIKMNFKYKKRSYL